jgi:hypothetical protein
MEIAVMAHFRDTVAINNLLAALPMSDHEHEKRLEMAIDWVSRELRDLFQVTISLAGRVEALEQTIKQLKASPPQPQEPGHAPKRSRR